MISTLIISGRRSISLGQCLIVRTAVRRVGLRTDFAIRLVTYLSAAGMVEIVSVRVEVIDTIALVFLYWFS